MSSMTSMERVLTSLGHKEPDRVPFFLLPTMHGARELGVSLREYYSKADYMVEGQIRMQQRYRHDCLCGFAYAAVETEAWGGEVRFRANGPPNAGAPLIQNVEDILKLKPPQVERAACLEKVLATIRLLKARVGDTIPIIGVVMSPFSLPVMQLGFESYLDVMLTRPDLFNALMAVNEAHCVNWANAQLAAGATAICYFDPVSSSTIIPPSLYRQTGFRVAQRTLARIKGPTATHLASGLALPILEDLARTGTAAVGVSAHESLIELKRVAAGKVSLLGNLNGVEMCRWTAQEAESIVRRALLDGGPGGGFILSDNHGEIPWQVPETVLDVISATVLRWGVYPLKGL